MTPLPDWLVSGAQVELTAPIPLLSEYEYPWRNRVVTVHLPEYRMNPISTDAYRDDIRKCMIQYDGPYGDEHLWVYITDLCPLAVPTPDDNDPLC